MPVDVVIGTTGTATTSTGNTTTSTSRALASTTTGDLNVIVIDVSPLANTTDPGVPTVDGVAISTTVGGLAGGWVTIGTSWDTGSPGPRLTAIGRVRVAGDPTSVTIAWASAGNHAANCVSFNAGTFDAATASSWLEAGAIQAQVASSVSFPTPSITTANRARIFSYYGNRTAGGPWTDTGAAIVTSGQSVSSANFALFDAASQAAGTYTRTGTWTAATSVGNAGIFAIRAAPNPSFSGSVALSGSGSLAASGAAPGSGTLALTGSGTLATTGSAPVASGSVALSGSGTLGITSGDLATWLALPGKRFTGHRDGFYATYGEFTVAGFTALKNHNPQVAWNIDVYQTTDGVWVASHDSTTGRVLSGTSLTISSSTWSQISGKTTLVGGNPVARIDDIVAIAPAGTIFFVDNKQNINASAFLSKLSSLGLTSSNTVIKSYIDGANTMTPARNAGYTIWAYAFDTTADMTTLASNHALADWLGFDYNGSQANWNTVISYGQPSFAHIIATQAAQATADSKATTAGGSNFGYMVSDVAAVVPPKASGPVTLSGSGSLTSAATVTATGAAPLTGSGSLTTSATVTASGSVNLSGAGTVAGTGTPGTSGSVAYTGSSTFAPTGKPAAVATLSTSGSGTLTLSTTGSATGVATLTGDGTLTTTAVPSAAGATGLAGTGALTLAGQPSTTGPVALSGAGQLTGAGVPTPSGSLGLAGAGSLALLPIVGTVGTPVGKPVATLTAAASVLAITTADSVLSIASTPASTATIAPDMSTATITTPQSTLVLTEAP